MGIADCDRQAIDAGFRETDRGIGIGQTLHPECPHLGFHRDVGVTRDFHHPFRVSQEIDEGQIWIGGTNVTWEEPKDRGIGMVFQSYALYPRMTVGENLSFGLKMAKFGRDESQKRIAKAAQILQIQPLLQRRPGELSGGQRQRVAIGRALVRDVDVFLFDEPLSNLDAKLRTELRVEIKKLHEALGSTMIYVTHDQIEALTLADRIAVMHRGVIQQRAPPKEIYQRPVNRFVAGFVGSPSMSFINGQLETSKGTPMMRLAEGSLVPLDGYRFERSAQPGQPIVLGLRPEQILLKEMPERASTLPFNYSVVEPMGADTLVWGTVGKDMASVRVAADAHFSAGDRLQAHFLPDQASIFDAGSGDRI